MRGTRTAVGWGLLLALALPAASQETATWAGHGLGVLSIAFAPDGASAVSGDSGGELKLWETATGKLLSTFGTNEAPVSAVAFSRDGKKIYATAVEGGVTVWGSDGRRIQDWRAHAGLVTVLAVTPNGKLLASGSRDATRKLWNLARGGMAAQWKKREDAVVLSADFTADGNSVVFGSDDGTVRVCSLSKKENELAPPCDVLKFEGCGLTRSLPDGRQAFSACVNGDVVRWDLGGGKDRMTVKGSGSRINAAALSPDGRLAVTGGDDETVRLWDVGGMRLVSVLRGHKGPVMAVSFSPDGKTILSGGDDRLLKTWDVASELACAEKFAAGRQLLDGGKAGEAKAAFEAAAACRPANVDFLNWLGSVYGDLGEHAKAVETLRNAAGMSRNAAWNFYLGRSLLAQGLLAEAKTALADGLNESPLNNRGTDRRGDVRVLMDKLEAYVTAMETAASRMGEGRFDDARVAAEGALAHIPTPQAQALIEDASAKLAAEQRRSRNRTLGILVFLLAAIGGGGGYFWRKRQKAKAEEAALNDSPPAVPPAK
ncbi:MAG: WD40 repeat domain-containing protein [Elusimicrobiota bacterium]|jgi:hypothetical protein